MKWSKTVFALRVAALPLSIIYVLVWNPQHGFATLADAESMSMNDGHFMYTYVFLLSTFLTPLLVLISILILFSDLLWVRILCFSMATYFFLYEYYAVFIHENGFWPPLYVSYIISVVYACVVIGVVPKLKHVEVPIKILRSVSHACIYLLVLFATLWAIAPASAGEDWSQATSKASDHFFKGENDAGLQWAEQALEIAKANVGPLNRDMGHSHYNVALGNFKLNNVDVAEQYFLKSIEIYESAYGKDHYYIGLACRHLGRLATFDDDYEKAAPYFQRSLGIMQSNFEIDHPEVGTAQIYLGLNAYSLKDLSKAMEYAGPALVIVEKLGYLNDHFDLMTTLELVGIFAYEYGSYDEAQRIFKKLVYEKRVEYGEKHHQVANAMNYLAAVFLEKKDYEQSEKIFLQAHSMLRHMSKHKQIKAQSLRGLVRICDEQDRVIEKHEYEEALRALFPDKKPANEVDTSEGVIP